MLNGILLLGPTASGKTPLGEMLEANGIGSIRCHHFDFGNELRLVARDDDNSGYFSDEEIRFINRVLNEGFLLEDGHFNIARKIFMAFTEARGIDEADITVLNGLPRHAGQAERMADIVDIGLVINLVCSKDNILCRIEENTGGDRTARKDDHKELV
ncbi:MAG: hypothetical protein JSV21_01715, partial [Nitrospirota bacterium]